MKKRVYLIDIDGTVCDDVPNEEPERMGTCEPYPDALEICNKWYEEGHIIFFFTSRTEAHRAYTEIWLKKHGFKYHGSQGFRAVQFGVAPAPKFFFQVRL